MNSEQVSSLLLITGLFTFMYFILIRPQKKQEKEKKRMIEALKPGDAIVTIGGIYGTIVRIKDNRVTIASGSDKTRIEIDMQAISRLENASDKPVKTKKTEAAEEKAEKTKPSSKGIKRLGKKEEAPAETVTDTEVKAVEPAQTEEK